MKTKKNFLKKLTAGILGFVMTLGVGAAGYAGAASEARADSWTRCSAVSDLTSGGTFIIGYEQTAGSGTIIPMRIEGTATTSSAGFIYSGSTSGSSTNGTISMANITDTSGYEVIIESSTITTGEYCIKVGDKYVGNKNTKNNCLLFTEQDAQASYAVSVKDGVFTFKISGNSSYHTFSYNSSSPRFACYGGTQKNLTIFKKTSGSSSSITIIGGEKTVTLEKGGSADSNVKYTSTGTGTLSAAFKSGVDVATLSLADGTVTITPSSSTTGTGVYKLKIGDVESTNSITVTVNEPSPTPTGTQYELINSTSDLVAGSKYIIGTGNSGSVVFMSNKDGTNANNRGVTSATVSSNKVSLSDSMLVLELGGSSGAWTFLTTNYADGSDGYLASASSGKNNQCRVISDSTTATVSFSNDNALINIGPHTERTLLSYNYNQGNSLFACYSSQQTSGICLYKEMSTDPTFAIAPASLNMHLYGEDEEANFVTANIPSPSFTIAGYKDNDDETFSASSSVVEASISGSKITVHAIGSGTSVISVNETTKTKNATLTITVDRIPHSATMLESVELESGGSSTSKFKSLSTLLQVYDEGGTEISLDDCTIDWTPQSSDFVGFSPARIFGKTAGEAEVTATITVPGGDPIVKSCTVTVLNDYPHASSWNFEDSTTIKLEYYAGDTFEPDGLVAKYKTHFHHENYDPYYTMPNTSLTYTTSSNGTGKLTSYVFSEDDVGTGKTIYVYYGDSQITSISGITVTARDIPLQSLSFTEGSSGELTRGDSLTLHPVFNPTNATMGRNLTWTPVSSADGVTVSQSGVVSVATNAIPGSKVTVTATTDYKPEGSSESIKATYEVTVKRETQTVHVVQSTPETWDIADSISAGDEIALVAYWQRWEFNGTISSNRGGYITYGEEEGDDPTGIYPLIVEENDGLYAFYHKNEDGTKTYINQKGADNKMNLTSTAHYFSVSFSDYDDIYLSFTDSNNKSRTLVANSSSGLSGGRFAFYLDSSAIKDKSGGEPNSNYELVTAYKKSGGTVESDETVSDTLYNAVMAATPYLNSDWSMVQSKLQTIITTAGLDYTILQHGVKNALGNEVEQFLAAYDNLVLNSGKTDFLHRFKTYTVSFDTQCEAQISPVSVMEGGKITAPQQPENPGYTFNGWYLGDNEFNFNTEITADITLTAHWTINQYSISYAENSHVSISGTSSFEYGASNVSVSLVADNGYSLPASVTATCGDDDFTDFTYSNGTFALTGTMPAGNITISGNGTANVYNITYNMNGGTNNPDNPSTYTVEDAITLEAPTKDGCEFAGWSPSGTIAKGSTGDKEFTATWNAKTYNVSFIGTNATLTGDSTCAFGSTYNGTIVVQSPYHLPGSISVKCGDNDVPYNYNNSTGELSFTMPAGSVTITANATSDYAISYFEVDGTAITGDYLINSYQEGVGVTLVNAHDKTGYVFAGWYDNALLTGSPVTVISTQDTGPKTFYAKWTYAGQDALDCVSTNLGVSYTYSKNGGDPVVSKSVDETTYHYEKVTSEQADWSGTYILVCDQYSLAWTGVDTASCNTSVAISDGQIADKNGAVELKIEAMTGGYSIKLVGGDNDGKYISGKTDKDGPANGFTIGTTAIANSLELSSKTIEGVETSYTKITSDKGTVMAYNAAANNERFRFYKSSTASGYPAVQLYKKVADTPTPPPGPTYDSTFKFNVKNTGLSSLISMYSGAYDDMGIAVSYTDSNNNDRVRYFSFIADENGKFWVKEANKDPIEFKFNKDGTSFALNLGDVLNNIDVANIEFTVQAYIYEGGEYHLSNNKTTMSLMDWIDGYYAIPKYQAAVKEIHDILHELLGE